MTAADPLPLALLVGFTADAPGEAALALARTLLATARAAGQAAHLTVCTVTPGAWYPPGLGRVDQEYADHLHEHAESTLARARELLKGEEADYRHITAPSTSAGLLSAAQEAGAALLVLGPSRSAPAGRVTASGLGGELLHLSPCPVAVAPSGYQMPAGGVLTRLTAAYAGTEQSGHTARRAHALAARLGLPLRLAAFAVRDKQMHTSAAGYRADDLIVGAWRERTETALNAVSRELTSPVPQPALTNGDSWDDAVAALGWQPGDLLALGSSRQGTLARVFLGSNASRILRASPAPVLVLPRDME